MQVVPRLAPIALERELLDRIDAAHPRAEPGRTLVIVPTTRLAEHLQRRLTERRPAWLGLRVMNFSGLTREILSRQPVEAPHVASDLLLEALLGRLGAAHADNRWIEFTRARPGALRALHETLKDLREAGVEPEIVAECQPDGGLAEIYAAYHEALEIAGDSGWTDRAGLARLAARQAAEFAADYQSIFVHGAYEWTGVNLDLLREMDRGRELTVLVPAGPGTQVSRFSERFATKYLGGIGVPGDDSSDAKESGTLPLDALFDEESSPEPAAEGRLTFAHAQGATAEVKLAVREALRAVAEGCHPTEIVLTARSLTPYAAALEEIFEDEGLNWTSSLATPLRRVPLVREFLLLLKVLSEGFPRAATVALLRSPLIDWPALHIEQEDATLGDCADCWSREAGLIGGIEDWTQVLPRWAAEPKTHPGQSEEEIEQARLQAAQDQAQAERIARCVTALNDAVGTESRRWGAHAEQLRGWIEFFQGDEATARAVDALAGLFDEMARLENLVGDDAEVRFERMRNWLEQAVDRGQVDLHPRGGGGIRVIDAMQLRGLTCRRLHLLGLNAGLFPRSPREDPILDDDARREIARKSGRPLARKLDAADEERLLLGMLLGSASDAVRVSWQRADRSGKAQTPSLVLRELARLRYGSPDLKQLNQDARHIRSHPAQELEDLLDDPGLLSPQDEMLLTTLDSSGVEQADALGERFESLVPGLTMLRATESWDYKGPEYDARVGARSGELSLSVSALETLGTCPLKFFFQRRLRVEEFPDEPSPVSMPSRDLGSTLHDLLEQVYTTLREEGLFERERSVDLVNRALELLEQRRESILGDLGRRGSRRLPVLWKQLEQSWLSALIRTVRADLVRAENGGLRLVGVEEQRREKLEFGRGATVRISARFDRRFEGEDGSIVGDYKTSTKLSDRVNPTSMLKGKQLQVPLYQMLAGPGSSVEILGIHPDLDETDTRELFNGFTDDERQESFRDTMRVLLGLDSAGVYPFRPDRHCNWCPYRSACRRNHPPSADRETRSTDAAAFRGLSVKTKTKPYG